MTQLYCGMDLHSSNTYIGILNEKLESVFKKRVQNESTLILHTLLPFKKPLKGIVVESTYNSYWLVDVLMEHGYKVHLANPAGFSPYKGLKYENDKQSAFFLARLLALGILPEGYIYPKAERPIRDLLRHRLFLMKHCIAHRLSLQSMIERNTGQRIRGYDIQKLTSTHLRKLFDNEYLFEAAQSFCILIEQFNKQIKMIEHQVKEAVKLKRPFIELLTIVGVGDILAMTIMLEVGDINRFPTVRDFSSYARCVPSKRFSNNKAKGENNKRNGNKYLAWAFSEVAMLAMIHNERIRTHYQKKKSKTNTMVALKALANKMARAAYYVMRDKKPFIEDKLFS